MNGRSALPEEAHPPFSYHQNNLGTMNKRKESKMREMDRENRLTGTWTGIGFVIVLLGALALAFLLMG